MPAKTRTVPPPFILPELRLTEEQKQRLLRLAPLFEIDVVVVPPWMTLSGPLLREGPVVLPMDVGIARLLAERPELRGLSDPHLLGPCQPLDIALPDGHPLGARASLSPADLADQTWIGTPAGLPFDRILRGIEAANGTPAHIAQRFADNGIVEALVAAGHGIAVLPRYTTRDRENGLITRPLTGVRASRLISVLMRPDRAERPSVRAVVTALKDEATRFEALHTV